MTMKVWNNGERVLHADINLNFYAPQAGNAGTGSWARAATGFNFADAVSTAVAVSPNAAPAMLAFTRTSDSGTGNAGGQLAYAFGALALNDNTAAVQTAYGAYFEARRSAGAGITHGVEFNVVNFGTVVAINPYFLGATGTTANYWASAGRSDLGTQSDLSCVFGIINNGARWSKGFVFGSNTIIAGTQGSEAITMPPGYGFMWSNVVDNATKAFIRSDASTASTSGVIGQIFTNSGVQWQTPDGLFSLIVNSGMVTTTNLTVSGTLSASGSEVVTGGFTANNLATFQGGVTVTGLQIAVNDAAAAALGVPLNGMYKLSSTGYLTTRAV